MSYLNHVLQPGEAVRYQGSLHWVLYLRALPWAILGAVVILVSLFIERFSAWWIAGVILLLAALSMSLRAWFERWTTEVLVTDRRVIYARGFIQRHTVEINMDKIESVDVDQSMMGRALNYGNVTIRGTGQTFEPLREIDRPIAFRNEVTAR
jgi:uncharacterized membrane protein YdbT with pleckstrin-like domain